MDREENTTLELEEKEEATKESGKLEMEEKGDGDHDVQMEDETVRNPVDDLKYEEVLDIMEQVITIYVSFSGMVPNVNIGDDTLLCILSIIKEDCPYRLLAPLLMFMVLCPSFCRRSSLRMAFKSACKVYGGHPIFNVDFQMMVHHILQDSPQPVLDALKTYTKLPVALNRNTFSHFGELGQELVHSDIGGGDGGCGFVDSFFRSTRRSLLNYDRIREHLNRMETVNVGVDLDCCTLYLSKVEKFLTTAQFIVCGACFSFCHNV